MKNLRSKQSQFVRAIGFLIIRAYELGYELTFGDTYPFRKHKKGSFHDIGLAIDLNLFRDGVYLTKTEDHEPLGLYWESLGGSWGGRFGESSPGAGDGNDGNHYSFCE